MFGHIHPSIYIPTSDLFETILETLLAFIITYKFTPEMWAAFREVSVDSADFSQEWHRSTHLVQLQNTSHLYNLVFISSLYAL